MVNKFISRNLSKIYEMFSALSGSELSLTEKNAEKVYKKLIACVEAKGGEVSARQRAAELADIYLNLDDEGRHAFMRLIALKLAPDSKKIMIAYMKYQANLGRPEQWDAETGLREALRSPRERILTQFNAIPQGTKFLVDFRAALLKYLKKDQELKVLDSELKSCLATWFDVGFLELTRLTWDSPAVILEKLIQYEAVHKIFSWDDLKNRLDSDRRCYAFFHHRMPTEPLIFVQVALLDEMAGNVQSLLDINAPIPDSQKATTAIFYSISNTNDGLRGISFGNFLLKRVIDSLKQDFPKLKTFATLSPVPGFMRWLKEHPEKLSEACTGAEWEKLAKIGVMGPKSSIFNDIIFNQPAYANKKDLLDIFRVLFLRTAAEYLLHAKKDGKPLDFVARFHLGNGAKVERLNWMADTSPKGMADSWGVMVNYLYDPDTLEENFESFASEGKITASSELKKLCERCSPQESVLARRKAHLRTRKGK